MASNDKLVYNNMAKEYGAPGFYLERGANVVPPKIVESWVGHPVITQKVLDGWLLIKDFKIDDKTLEKDYPNRKKGQGRNVTDDLIKDGLTEAMEIKGGGAPLEIAPDPAQTDKLENLIAAAEKQAEAEANGSTPAATKSQAVDKNTAKAAAEAKKEGK